MGGLLRPAGFLRRMVAYLIDSALIGFLSLLLLFAGAMGARLADDRAFFDPTGAAGRVSAVALSFLWIGYFTFFHARGGQTPAKRILRIQVVSGDAAPLSPVHALFRTLGYLFSALFFGAGFLMTLIEPNKRAFHDLLTGTQVVLTP